MKKKSLNKPGMKINGNSFPSYGNCSFVHRNVCSRYGNIC